MSVFPTNTNIGIAMESEVFSRFKQIAGYLETNLLIVKEEAIDENTHRALPSRYDNLHSRIQVSFASFERLTLFPVPGFSPGQLLDHWSSASLSVPLRSTGRSNDITDDHRQRSITSPKAAKRRAAFFRPARTSPATNTITTFCSANIAESHHHSTYESSSVTERNEGKERRKEIAKERTGATMKHLPPILLALAALYTPTLVQAARREPPSLGVPPLRHHNNVRAVPIPAVFRRQDSGPCADIYVYCPNTETCVIPGYTCCTFPGGCRPGTYCDPAKPGEDDSKNGCCPNGQKCETGGGVTTEDPRTKSSTSTTTTSSSTTSSTESVSTSTRVVTSTREPLTTTGPTNKPEENTQKDSDKPSTAVITGAAVGGTLGLVLLILLIVAFIFLRRRRNNAKGGKTTPPTPGDGIAYHGLNKEAPSAYLATSGAYPDARSDQMLDMYPPSPLGAAPPSTIGSTVVSPIGGVGPNGTAFGPESYGEQPQSPADIAKYQLAREHYAPGTTDGSRTEVPGSFYAGSEPGVQLPADYYEWKRQREAQGLSPHLAALPVEVPAEHVRVTSVGGMSEIDGSERVAPVELDGSQRVEMAGGGEGIKQYGFGDRGNWGSALP
ncbi:hypothetical protein BJ508DRAFT_332606 [Ascobolus immersus RN42]|uniref:Uncharacterized protein n=1 Tax=Ascobolus immersus RN42 TaxID=1160509 RepID=A0A3N4HNU0_ASCIM|nr:hypothetical protein BJ508DRAFT_332606 [Ascobolus immersus RN42]